MIGAPAGDDAVAGDLLVLVHAEIDAAMLHEHVEFLERAMVEQKLDTFARGELAALVLGVDTLLAAAEAGAFAPFVKGFDNVFHGGFQNGARTRLRPNRPPV